MEALQHQQIDEAILNSGMQTPCTMCCCILSFACTKGHNQASVAKLDDCVHHIQTIQYKFGSKTSWFESTEFLGLADYMWLRRPAGSGGRPMPTAWRRRGHFGSRLGGLAFGWLIWLPAHGSWRGPTKSEYGNPVGNLPCSGTKTFCWGPVGTKCMHLVWKTGPSGKARNTVSSTSAGVYKGLARAKGYPTSPSYSHTHPRTHPVHTALNTFVVYSSSGRGSLQLLR